MSKLKDGLIEAGKPCPFSEVCSLVNERCPTSKNLRKFDFSCASARGFDLIEERIKNEKTTNKINR